MSKLTPTQAATILGVSADRVRKLIAEGRLRATKFGSSWLIDPAALEQIPLAKRGRKSRYHRQLAQNTTTDL